MGSIQEHEKMFLLKKPFIDGFAAISLRIFAANFLNGMKGRLNLNLNSLLNEVINA